MTSLAFNRQSSRPKFASRTASGTRLIRVASKLPSDTSDAKVFARQVVSAVQPLDLRVSSNSITLLRDFRTHGTMRVACDGRSAGIVGGALFDRGFAPIGRPGLLLPRWLRPDLPDYDVKAIVGSAATTASAASRCRCSRPATAMARSTRPGDLAVFGFRGQAFVTRAYVEGVSGTSKGAPGWKRSRPALAKPVLGRLGG